MTSHWQADIFSTPRKLGLIMYNSVLQDQHCQPECPPLPPSLPQLLLLSVMWYKLSLWQVWVSCPGSVPCQLLVHHQLLVGRAT